MTKELIATILREVCETDPADATLPTTVCINVDVLGRIVEQALAQQEQPAQEACWCDQNNIGEPGVSCGDCPTRDYKQPALTYEDLETCREVAGKTFRRHKSSIRGQQLSEWDDWEWHLAKAIEAHCRGGNHG